MALNRRDVLTVTGLGLVGGAVLADGPAAAAAPRPGRPPVDGWGPLRPAGPELALPAGFGYRTFGAAADQLQRIRDAVDVTCVVTGPF